MGYAKRYLKEFINDRVMKPKTAEKVSRIYNLCNDGYITNYEAMTLIIKTIEEDKDE